MAERPWFILDTNVIFKWYVKEREGNLAQAEALFEHFLAGTITPAIPDALRYELSNLLRVSAGQGRLSAAQAQRAFSEFETLDMQRIETGPLVQDALELGITHRISVFDALCLLVGLRMNAAVVTDDERLVSACGAMGCRVVRLRDYSPLSGPT